jgi:hypothetical protein
MLCFLNYNCTLPYLFYVPICCCSSYLYVSYLSFEISIGTTGRILSVVSHKTTQQAYFLECVMQHIDVSVFSVTIQNYDLGTFGRMNELFHVRVYYIYDKEQ